MKKLSIFLLGLLLTQPAFAADLTIDGLGAGSAVSGSDIFPGYQGSNPAKGVTATQLKNFANTTAVRATTTTSEALANSDQNKLVTFSNGSAVAATIAQAGAGGNFAAGWAVSLKNLGAGTVTLTATTSIIDTAANFTVTLTTGQGLDLYSDGTNYFTQSGKGTSSSGANPSATGSDVAVNGSASTFMRSDGAPPIQKGSNAQFGLAEGDGASIDLTAGVVSRRALTGDVTASAGSGATTLAAGSASNLNSGTLNAARMPALTGDCTTSAGAVATTCAGIMAPQYILNNWYVEFGNQMNSTTTSALSSNIAYFDAIFFPTLITINSLEVSVITGNGNCRFGLYAPDTTTKNRPGALIASTASTSVSGSNTVTTAALLSNAQVQGRYFKIIACDNSTATFSGVAATSLLNGQLFGSATNTKIFQNGSNSNNLELSVPWTYANGALPSSMAPAGSTCGTGAQACTYTEVQAATRVPLFGYQVATVP